MASSKLQREVGDYLARHFSKYEIEEFYRPEWMTTIYGGRLELDFYIEELHLAIEVQGEQHYRFVPHFHQTPERYAYMLQCDREKRSICKERNITLYEVAGTNDLDGLLTFIRRPLTADTQPTVAENWQELRQRAAETRLEMEVKQELLRHRALKKKKKLEKQQLHNALTPYKVLKLQLADAIQKKDKKKVSVLQAQIQLIAKTFKK